MALYNLRKGPVLCLTSTHSTYYGTNSVHFRGSLIWNNLSMDIKSSKSLPEFKTKIKNFGNIDCGCVIYSRLISTLNVHYETTKITL